MNRFVLLLALSIAPSAALANEVGPPAISFYEDFDTIDWCKWSSSKTNFDYLRLYTETSDEETVTYLANIMDPDYKKKPVNVRDVCPGRAPPPASVARAADDALALETASIFSVADDPRWDTPIIGRSFFADAVPRFAPADEASTTVDRATPLEEDGPRGRLGGDLGANCPEPFMVGDGKVSQKNELLRFAEEQHDPHSGHWYGLRVRADGAIPTCGSIRSMLAQWKFFHAEPKDFDPDNNPVDKLHPNGQSPSLALRFDNGVLHATVQSMQCQCLVAKARGDQNFDIDDERKRQAASELAIASVAQSSTVPKLETLVLDDQVCRLNQELDDELKPACGASVPLQVTFPDEDGDAVAPFLPDPREDWVTLHVYIKSATHGDWPNDGRIELYANGEPIVRVTGGIGYKYREHPIRTVFKFGHYKDKIETARSRLLYDWVCADTDPAKCGPEANQLTVLSAGREAGR